MKINELNKKPISALRQKAMSVMNRDKTKDDVVIPKTYQKFNPNFIDEKDLNILTMWLHQNDFKYVGHGRQAYVFEKPHTNYVIKLFGTHKSSPSFGTKVPNYNEYLKYILEHQDNPHIPKILKGPKKLIDKIDIVVIEKLWPKELNQREENFIYNLSITGANLEDVINSYRNPAEGKKLAQRFGESFLNTIIDIQIDHGIDLGQHNIMQRSDGTLVLSDPW